LPLSPTRGFTGSVVFGYALADGVSAVKGFANVSIVVSGAVNSVVIVTAANDSYTATFGAAFSPAAGSLLLANDQPSNGTSVVGVVAQPSGGAGSVTVTAGGSFTFTPAAGWSGEEGDFQLPGTSSPLAQPCPLRKLTCRPWPQ
jgi:large repetitive protein